MKRPSIKLGVLLLAGLVCFPAWAATPPPTPSPSPLPEIVLHPETGPDPVVRMRAPRSYLAKKIGLFPLEFPAYVMRGATWPLLTLSRFMERNFLRYKVTDHPFRKERGPMKFFPIIQAGGGDGFGIGAFYQTDKFFGSGIGLAADYTFFADLDNRAALSITSPEFHLAGKPFYFRFNTRFRDDNEARFYGIGPDSQRADRSVFDYDRFSVGVEPVYEPFKNFTVSLPIDFMTAHGGAENDQDQPSIQQVFPVSELPAFSTRTNYAVLGVDLVHDTRNTKNLPRSGGYRAFRFKRFQGLGTGLFSFNQYDLDIQQYFKLWTPRHVLWVRNAWVFQQGTGAGGVPFDLLTRLDIDAPLRGFFVGRFRDTSSVLFNFEYIYPVWDHIDGSIFVDTGKVFPGIGDFDFSDWRYSVGAAVQAFNNDQVLFRVQGGYGGEGFVVFFRVGKNL